MAGRAATTPCCASQTKWRTAAWETLNGGFVPLTLVDRHVPFSALCPAPTRFGISRHSWLGMAGLFQFVIPKRAPYEKLRTTLIILQLQVGRGFPPSIRNYMAGNSQYRLSLIRRSQRRSSTPTTEAVQFFERRRPNLRRRLAPSASSASTNGLIDVVVSVQC